MDDKQQLDLVRIIIEKFKSIMIQSGVSPVAYIVGLTEELGGMLAAQGLTDENEALRQLNGAIRDAYFTAKVALEVERTEREEREEECAAFINETIAKAVKK